MTTAAATAKTWLDVDAEVRAATRVSPSFVRLELGGDALAECGTPGPLYDQRIKLLFPTESGDRAVRTYTVRDLIGSGTATRLVVDVVVHDPAVHSGPGNDWALRARAGDRVGLLAPRRGHAFGGIEWSPGDASRLLLVGDETAAPAIRGILRDLPADAAGAAFVEVPTAADIQRDVAVPRGVEVTWIPRGGAPRGASLHAAAVAWLTGTAAPAPVVGDDDVDPDLWETPVHSSSGEEVAGSTRVPVGDGPYAGLYAWIAGEAKVVTGLRRRLVHDLGVARDQVAFMGYWREGVAMRS